MSSKKTLHLVLKHKWYEMIESGEKKEEYRKDNAYWRKRLFNCRFKNMLMCHDNICARRGNEKCWLADGVTKYPFTEVCFHKGYTNTTMTFEIDNITRGYGMSEWGAEPYEKYFIIHLGKRL